MTRHELLHHLWTKAVGTPGYVKSDWQRLEAEIYILERVAMAARESGKIVLPLLNALAELDVADCQVPAYASSESP